MSKFLRTSEQIAEEEALHEWFSRWKPGPAEIAAIGGVPDPAHLDEAAARMACLRATETNAVFMPCVHPGCGRESTHCTDRWIVHGHHLHVDYWCAEHSPPGTPTFEEEEAEEERRAEDEVDNSGRTSVGFWFDLTLPDVGDLTPEVMDALFDAGCSDATPYRQDGVTRLMFARSAGTREEAIASAVRDVTKAGFVAEVADEDEAGGIVRRSMKDTPPATPEDLTRLLAAMDGPIDTSDIPESTGRERRLERDAGGGRLCGRRARAG